MTATIGGLKWGDKVKVCPNCGKEYKPRGNRQIFCSQECYWNYYDKQYKKKDEPEENTCEESVRECWYCGAPFKPKNERQHYCNAECYEADNEFLPPPELGYTRRCLLCGKEFKMTRSNRVFCNRGCQREFNRRKQRENLKEIRTCPICGKEFEKDRQHLKYCSDECRLKGYRIQNRESQERIRAELKAQADSLPVRPDKVGGIPTIEMPAPFRPVNENGKPTKRKSTLDQIIKEAQELGLSYGKYRALLNTGKTFEELKAKKKQLLNV